jgi:hypothetical protein
MGASYLKTCEWSWTIRGGFERAETIPSTLDRKKAENYGVVNQ